VTDNSHAAKKAMRARLREHLQQATDEQIRSRSAEACRHLTETPEFARAKAIMMFLPLPYEVDASAVALHAWQEGKLVTVPLVSLEQRHMIPVEIRSLTEPMHTDSLGVRAPAEGRPIPLEMIDLLIVPGLAFDRAGHRLGRGGGFYDRFMSHRSYQACSCGLAFDEQLVDRVPTSGHDVAIQMLVTDRQVVRFVADKNG
jgi:5-formyltetrahydrofolate cyclo-ligase